MIQEISVLNKLGYSVENGLCLNREEAENQTEWLYMIDAKKLGIDAVYFRRYFRTDDAEKPYHSEPTVCIFKKTDDYFNSAAHKELHAKLWSAGKTEVYIILTTNRIDIINARKPAKRVNETDVTLDDESLLLVAGKALQEFNDQRFAAHLFGSGTFWEQKDFKNKIDADSTPYIFLLNYLMRIRKKLSNATEINLEEATLDKLLVLSILIKFLEEIKDDNGKHTLREIYQKYRINSFAQALEKQLTCKIFDDLSNEFNGKIFDQFSRSEKENIQQADLKLIGYFLQADIALDTNQYFLWEQYSFQYLPAEVISAIYENFIQADASRKGKSEKGVVYTPVHLVNLLVDEAMPIEHAEIFFKNDTFQVLDPACGSGVFLVAAYKRMLQWWTINNSKNGIVKYPNRKTAQKILENNIFGVDIEETAVLVSIFGLTIALLDKLTPNEIWNNLKFQNLSEKNVVKANFSDWAKNAKHNEEKFDLVIGNPPFNPSSKGTITNEDFNELFGKVVPGNKLALKFFEAALFFGNRVCMILPSNTILYNNRGSYKNYRISVFKNHTVEKIYDFTHLKESLFIKKKSRGVDINNKKGRIPIVALFAKKQRIYNQSTEHIIIKREFFSEEKIRFEINYYDRHYVKHDWAINEKAQFVWKTNFLGGARLFHLINKLNFLDKFKDFIKDRKSKNPEWTYSLGYIVKGSEKKKEATYIFNNSSISTPTFTDSEDFESFVEKNKSFSWPRNPKIYQPPHLILKTSAGKNNVPIHYSEEYLCFNARLIGLHAPNNEKGVLKEIYSRFKEKPISNLYQLWIYATSPEAVIRGTACKKEDIDSLPFPDNKELLQLSKAEKIIQDDVLDYFIHLGKSIAKNRDGAILHQPTIENELLDFGKIYCETLNEIYSKKDQSWQLGKVIHSPMFVSYQFGFGKNDGLKYEYNEEKSDEVTLKLLTDTQSNRGAIHKRIIKYYNHQNDYDCVYFIKPNSKRYWLKSIALRDADDTFMDLKKEGF